MTSAGKTIGLCMIVKNEARVIVRCLDSVRRLIDYVLVEDTGSEDGTQDVIRDWTRCAGLPGVVFDEPWRDFAVNRTHALASLRKRPEIDYALMIDADDIMVFERTFDPAAFKATMSADFYDIEVRHATMRHFRPHIFRNSLPFEFRGVVHEYVEQPANAPVRETPAGFHIHIIGGGGRSQDRGKFQRDAALLANALATERDPFLISRYTYYLGQSYRDSGDPGQALVHFLRRAELGFWQEEVFISLYYAAQMKEQLGHGPDEVVGAYLKASDALPTRAEALHAASRFLRSQGRNEEAFQLARRGHAIAMPFGGMFVEPSVYKFGLLDEIAINGYWAGRYSESLEASIALLASPDSPADQRERYAANARFALAKLPRDAKLGPAGNESLDDQHADTRPRRLRSRRRGPARILLAILAKQKEPALPLFLQCIEALDYPKTSVVLHVRTNNNTDRTEAILREWIGRVGHLYAHVEIDAGDVDEPVERFAEHEWNEQRFRVLGRIRNVSMRRALDLHCKFYFVADIDNFIKPCTLRELVALDLPIVAPFLRDVLPYRYYSNYHADIDVNGYYRECDQYLWVLNRWIRGIIELPVVHCTYLVRCDVLPELSYEDPTGRYEYVIFSESARRAGIPQYLDNRQIYGYITFGNSNDLHVPDGIDRVRRLLACEAPPYATAPRAKRSRS